MKIERISENQIKCTLNRLDLASRQIKLSELAYGTEKTKSLFQDMMEQASTEFGFDADDNPLMIEAIPVSMDCLVLMITKVNEPEELDTKFSSFTNLDDVISGADADSFDEDNEEEDINMTAEEESRLFAALLEEISTGTAGTKAPLKKSGVLVEQQIFSFDSLDRVIEFAHHIKNEYNEKNDLYKSTENDRFYLLMNRSDLSEREFGAVCASALEYGSKEPSGFARSAYISEHYKLYISGNAIQSLANV